MNEIVVLVSGGGSNLQNLIDAIDGGILPDVKIIKVIADRPCNGLHIADRYGIPSVLGARNQIDNLLREELTKNIKLVVAAGFLSIIPPDICEKFKNKIINIHPSLLPKYGGRGMWGHHVHQAVLAQGERESGATVHYVTQNIDKGEIILQQRFDLQEDETLETLQKKISDLEKKNIATGGFISFKKYKIIWHKQH